MSNLIPTPIVDKNGVASTRHKKQVTHADASSIPAPRLSMEVTSDDASASGSGEASNGNFFTRWQDKRRQKKAAEADAVLRKQLTDDLLRITDAGNMPSYAGINVADTVRNSLETNLSTEDIHLAVELAKLFTRDEVSKEDAVRDCRNLAYTLEPSIVNKGIDIQVRAMSAHTDWLRDHPGEANRLRTTIHDLVQLDMVPNGGNDGIQNLDGYMAAALYNERDSHGIYAIWRKDYMNAAAQYPDRIDDVVTYIRARQGFVEEGFEDFMSAAAKHPERVEKMRDYMAERGTFDEEGFEQYDDTALPLADGAL